MLTTLNFSFLYPKPQLCSYVICIMTHLHLANDFKNLNILKSYLELRKSQVPQSLNYECISNLDGTLSSFQKNSHQHFFIKRILSLMLYKIDFLVLKFKSLLLKPKLNLLNQMI